MEENFPWKHLILHVVYVAAQDQIRDLSLQQQIAERTMVLAAWHCSKSYGNEKVAEDATLLTLLSKKGCKSSHQLISGGTCDKLCAVAHKDAESHLNRSATMSQYMCFPSL